MYLPGISDALALSSVSLSQWLMLLGVALLLLLVEEGDKWSLQRRLMAQPQRPYAVATRITPTPISSVPMVRDNDMGIFG